MPFIHLQEKWMSRPKGGLRLSNSPLASEMLWCVVPGFNINLAQNQSIPIRPSASDDQGRYFTSAITLSLDKKPELFKSTLIVFGRYTGTGLWAYAVNNSVKGLRHVFTNNNNFIATYSNTDTSSAITASSGVDGRSGKLAFSWQVWDGDYLTCGADRSVGSPAAMSGTMAEYGSPVISGAAANRVYLAAQYTRQLSIGELWALNENPWQLFAHERRTIYFDVGGSIVRRNRLSLLS